MLVDEDDGGAGGEAEEGEEVEAGVGDLAAAFGGGRPGGLEDLDGEGQGQDAEGVEQWVRGDEGEEGVQEDGEPDAQGEEDGADEGDPAGSCGFVSFGMERRWDGEDIPSQRLLMMLVSSSCVTSPGRPRRGSFSRGSSG